MKKLKNLMRGIIFLLLIILLFITCKKQDTVVINEEKPDVQLIYPVSEPYIRIPENDPPMPSGMYPSGMDDGIAPEGKLLRVYESELLETLWGEIRVAPIMYLYDKDNRILGTYDVSKILSEKFWAGNIQIRYNSTRNSFDLIFSLDAYGNYGTGYIDLNTYEFIRELKIIEQTEEEKKRNEEQGIPDREEGAVVSTK